LREAGRLEEAVTYHQRALDLFAMLGDRHSEGVVLNDLGTTYRRLGRLEEAVTYHQRALDLFAMLGDRHSEGVVLNDLGTTYRRLGRSDDALRAFERASAQFESIGAFRAADAAREAGSMSEVTEVGERTTQEKERTEVAVEVSSPPASIERHDPTSDSSTEFSAFYRKSFSRLVSFLMLQGADLADATDIAQESMIDVYRKWESISKPEAWVRTVASRKYHTSIASIDRSADRLSGRKTVQDMDIAEREEGHDVLGLLERLPPRQRQVMAWSYDGFTPSEIANELNMTAPAVRRTLKGARAKLIELLNQANDDLL
jgi:RNA polymerase sigma-70 factor (ECF subfamily)